MPPSISSTASYDTGPSFFFRLLFLTKAVPATLMNKASYWTDRFCSRGYQVYDVIRPSIWRDSQVAWWYKQNIILFANAEAASGALRNVLPTQNGMLDLIHPEHLLAKVWENRRLSERFNTLEKFLARGSLFEVNRTADGQMNINKRS
jgi:hypothetical protein